MKRAIVALVALAALGMAQDQAAQQPKKKMAKDQKEANLINSAMKETDAAKRLEMLNEWDKGYPKSDFAENRELMYLGTYQELKQYRQAFNKANEILKTNPNDFNSLYFVLLDVMQLDNGKPAAADLAAAEKVADRVLNDTSTVFAAGNKPATMTAAQWGQVVQPVKVLAQRTVALIYVTRKDNPRAETELKKSLALQPNDGQVDRLLADALLAQQHDDPNNLPQALFYYARAAAFDGQGSLPAASRQQIQGFLTRAYTTYHGSDDGVKDLLATAKTNANPPAGFKIPTAAEIEQAKADKAAEFARDNPAAATWKTVKTGLTGDNPDTFWGTVKDAALPGESNGTKLKFSGTLVSMTPANRPKQLVVAVENPAGDVTLTFDEPLTGKMDPGAVLQFNGVAKAYTKDPFMLTLNVDKDDLVGWKPIPPPRRPAARKKKAK